MLFSSRKAPRALERMRLLLWPRRTFARSGRYVFLRIMRLKGDPHALALGVAVGTFVAALPVFGVQMLVAALIAWTLRASVAAALLATFLANPIVTPLLWVAAYAAGQYALGTTDPLAPAEILGQFRDIGLWFKTYDVSHASRMVWPLLKPLVLGSVLIGGVLAAAAYWIAFHLAATYRHSRLAICTLADEPVLGMPSRRPS